MDDIMWHSMYFHGIHRASRGIRRNSHGIRRFSQGDAVGLR
jgi:hypothetical protein